MTPSRVRLGALLALVVPVGLSAAAGSASAAFPALALATAAAGLAMLLAGPVFRVVLAVLVGLLGICVALVAVSVPEGPVGLALVAGIIQALVAAGIAVTAKNWPPSGSRYSRSRLSGDPTSDWDALSEGDDPTDEAR